MANKHMKRCSTTFLSKEIQLKAAMRYYHTLIKMAKFQNQTKPTAGKDTQQQKLTIIAYGNTNGTTTLDGSLEVSYKTKSGLITG